MHIVLPPVVILTWLSMLRDLDKHFFQGRIGDPIAADAELGFVPI